MSIGEGKTEPTRIAFLLVPKFTMIALSSALEPLRMANQLSGEHLYDWVLVSAQGAPVQSSCGISLAADRSFADPVDYDAVFVCGGNTIHHYADEPSLAWLKSVAKQKVILGALCTGSYLLAKSELLDGYRCTIHWENIASAREEYPHLVISPELFEIDRDRYTCAGGIAPLDMMLCEIRARHGSRLATSISEQFMCERIRDQNDRQRVPLTQRIGTSQRSLQKR